MSARRRYCEHCKEETMQDWVAKDFICRKCHKIVEYRTGQGQYFCLICKKWTDFDHTGVGLICKECNHILGDVEKQLVLEPSKQPPKQISEAVFVEKNKKKKPRICPKCGKPGYSIEHQYCPHCGGKSGRIWV
jgi:hypothetical protein